MECSKNGDAAWNHEIPRTNRDDDVSSIREAKVKGQRKQGQRHYRNSTQAGEPTMDLLGEVTHLDCIKTNGTREAGDMLDNQEVNPLISTTASVLCSQPGCWDQRLAVHIRGQ